ncbi:MAG: hypothetical protein K2M30_03355 [Desulfovibrionaceae bacterium]|nr:hypothetical protein [Desulfovibrionaceae bacterium]
MKYSLLFSLEIPHNNRKRYKEVYLGFSWLIVFYSILVPFFKDRATKLGWLMVLSQAIGFFISGVIGDIASMRMIPEITNIDDLAGRIYISFLTTCFVWLLISFIWGYYYNTLHVRYILEEGYIPEDEYTERILQEQGIDYTSISPQ